MRQRERNVLIAGAIFGFVAGAVFRGVFDPVETRTALNFLRSALNGSILAVSMVFADQWLGHRAEDWLRRRSLAVELLVSGAVLALAATVAQVFAQAVLFREPWSMIVHLLVPQIGFALSMAMLFLAVDHTARLVGAGQFMRVLVGHYRRPVEEHRVFLFADLVGATRLAESLGPVRVQALIARFFHDVDETIVDHGGEVHAYIGDEVIVTWPLATGVADAACLCCVFAMRDRIGALAESYEAEFGTVPAFRAALHCGPVVLSEIGRSKGQIGIFGDTVNVAARLEQHAKDVDRGLLVSGDLIDRLNLPPGAAVEDLGELALRGRDARLRAFAVERP